MEERGGQRAEREVLLHVLPLAMHDMPAAASVCTYNMLVSPKLISGEIVTYRKCCGVKIDFKLNRAQIDLAVKSSQIYFPREMQFIPLADILLSSRRFMLIYGTFEFPF